MAGPPGKLHLGRQGEANSIDGALIASNVVVGSHISAGVVVGSHVAADAIIGSHISAGVVVGSHVAADAIIGSHISAAVVVGSHLAANAVVGSHVSAGVIVGSHVATNAVTGSTQIVASSIPEDRLSFTIPTAADFVDNEVYAATAAVTTFALANTPNSASGVHLEYRGQGLRPTTDYSITDDVVTLTGWTAASGDWFKMNYRKP